MQGVRRFDVLTLVAACTRPAGSAGLEELASVKSDPSTPQLPETPQIPSNRVRGLAFQFVKFWEPLASGW